MVTFVFLGVVRGEDLQLGFHLSNYPQSDRDLGLVQKFLLFSADQTLDYPHCSFAYELDGYAIMSGPEESLQPYVISFGGALEKIIREGIPRDQFEGLKSSFVSFLGDALAEKELAREIKWEMAQDVGESLNPMQHMMLSLLPDQNLSSQPEIAVVSLGHNPQAYYQLRLTAEDQSNISKMIKNLGELGWLGLLKKKSAMEKLGDNIFPVHPLRFLGYVVSNPSLKKQLPKIMGDFVKRKSFLNGHGKRIGFAQRMSNEVNHHNMLQYIPGFAQQVGVSEVSLQKYFSAHDWEGLIRDLMGD
jgi:hypothetical protein